MAAQSQREPNDSTGVYGTTPLDNPLILLPLIFAESHPIKLEVIRNAKVGSSIPPSGTKKPDNTCS